MSSNRKTAVDLQRHIFMGGLRGDRPVIPLEASALRALAKEKLPAKAFGYLDGSAGRAQTDKDNRMAFDQWQIIPRMLRDVSRRDTHLSLLGHTLTSPFFLCPIGVLELVHPEADLAVARACEECGVPLMISNQASYTIESITDLMISTPKFFQLYWSKSEELVSSLVSRAERSGCVAIVVTLDTTLLGWRTRDLDNAYLPFLYGMGLAQYISDPVFQHLINDTVPQDGPAPKLTVRLLRSLWEMASRYPGSTLNNLRKQTPLRAIRKFIEIYMNPALQWDDLQRLRAMTNLPVLLKGIQHPDDARKAVDYGMDGMVVSNHGGRQVDGAISSLEALQQCRKAIGDQITIVFDSGIRSGADAFKAIALGADAVGIGRPYAYALGVGGQMGVKTLIESFQAEFELTMALSGCRNISEVRETPLMRKKT